VIFIAEGIDRNWHQRRKEKEEKKKERGKQGDRQPLLCLTLSKAISPLPSNQVDLSPVGSMEPACKIYRIDDLDVVDDFESRLF
jgi:hypothetical protein